MFRLLLNGLGFTSIHGTVVVIAAVLLLIAAIYCLYQLLFGKTTKDKTVGMGILGAATAIFVVLFHFLSNDSKTIDNQKEKDKQTDNAIDDLKKQNEVLKQKNDVLEKQGNSIKNDINTLKDSTNSTLNQIDSKTKTDIDNVNKEFDQKQKDLDQTTVDTNHRIAESKYNADESVDVINNIVNGTINSKKKDGASN